MNAALKEVGGLRMFNDAAIQGEVERLYSQLPPGTRGAALVTYDAETEEIKAWGAVKLRKGWTIFGQIEAPKSALRKVQGTVGLLWAGE